MAGYRDRGEDFREGRKGENAFPGSVPAIGREDGMRARIISFINLKGGVAKTTTCVGTALSLAGQHGKRVLLIDMDPQTNATIMLIGDKGWMKAREQNRTLYDLFDWKLKGKIEDYPMRDAIIRSVGNVKGISNLDLFPSSLDLCKIQDNLISVGPASYFGTKPHEVLRDGLGEVVNFYDYILLDCPPSMGILPQNALFISDAYIIPTIPDVMSMYGIPQVMEQVESFRSSWGKELFCLGIVATKVNEKNSLHMRKLKEMEDSSVYLFKTRFPESAYLSMAAEYGVKMTFRQRFGYQKVSSLFPEFAKEVMERMDVVV